MLSGAAPMARLGRVRGTMAAFLRRLVGRSRQGRLTYMALHDPETGLPNRHALQRRVAATPGAYVAVVGVDRFEIMRNAIGYDAMALLLAALGARLASMTESYTLARVGDGAGEEVVGGLDALGDGGAAGDRGVAGADPAAVGAHAVTPGCPALGPPGAAACARTRVIGAAPVGWSRAASG